MKCGQCSQQATLHITDAREGTACGEAHLCEGCARTFLHRPDPSPAETHPPGPLNPDGEFRFEVARVILSEVDDHQVVVLREVGGPRSFPIVIGIFEATSIDRRLKGMPSPRPLTHDGWLATIAATGARIAAAGIDRLEDFTYFASLRLIPPGGTDASVRVDLRPSDAILMALLAGVPLFIPGPLLDELTAD